MIPMQVTAILGINYLAQSSSTIFNVYHNYSAHEDGFGAKVSVE